LESRTRNGYQVEETWNPGQETDIRLMKNLENAGPINKNQFTFLYTEMPIKGASDDIKKRATFPVFPYGVSLRPFEPIFISYADKKQ
jgi:hypothetical protein